MAYVTFATALGPVAVRPDLIFAAVDTPAAGVELWWDGAREVVTSEAFAAVAGKLPGFVEAPVVGQGIAACVVNPRLVAAVVPNPDNAGVCFLQGMARRIAVAGGLAETVQRLGG